MPFTFSHPAAILPFLGIRKSPGWRESLVAGALAPDLVRPVFSANRAFTHSLAGWLLVDLPAALLFAWVLRRWFTPRFRRLPGMGPELPATGFAIGWAILACAIGTGTHLSWDLLTHEGSPLHPTGLLGRPLFLTRAGPFTVAHLVWPAHSVVGILALLGWFLAKVVRSSEGPKALLAGCWLRLSILPLLPATLLLRGQSISHQGLLEETALRLLYRDGATQLRVLAMSSLLFATLFYLETRKPRGA